MTDSPYGTVMVTLTSSYIHLAERPSEWVSVNVVSTSEQVSQPGSTHRYADGVHRTVTSGGTHRTVAVAMTWMTVEDHARLERWLGNTILYRDPKGAFIYGTFLSLTAAQTTHPNNELIPQVTATITQTEPL